MANTYPFSLSSKPLNLALLNLMPNKDETEAQFRTWLGETGRPTHLTLLRLDTYRPRHAPEGFYERYASVSEVRDRKFDGLIITGAPIGRRNMVQASPENPNGVDYWNELREIFDWSTTHASQTLNICWAAAAALNHFRGIDRELGEKKFFGVSLQQVADTSHPLTRRLGATYEAPVSRTVIIRPERVGNLRQFDVLSHDPETGLGLAQDSANRQTLMFNHLEYEAHRLQREYQRDCFKGLNPELPRGYDVQNPQLTWQPARRAFMQGWLENLAPAQVQRPRISHQLQAAP